MTRESVPAGELTLEGRLLPASNATFVAQADGVRVVYKPIAGERPLWDFPDGTLANREVAAYVVSEALGWDIVPPTSLREGPHGPGMVQVWRDVDEEQHAVDVVARDAVPTDVRAVFEGLDAHDQPVVLVHEATAPLRRIALFDVVINNADRKGGHVLPMADGHRHGVDHGVAFHVEPKLRTVLWGWVGEELDSTERHDLASLLDRWDSEVSPRLDELLDAEEVAATHERLAELVREGTFPVPVDTGYPVIPWPPM